MRRLWGGAIVIGLMFVGRSALAHEEHQHDARASQDQTLTGEVVDVFCYLSHGKDGLGQGQGARNWSGISPEKSLIDDPFDGRRGRPPLGLAQGMGKFNVPRAVSTHPPERDHLA